MTVSPFKLPANNNFGSTWFDNVTLDSEPEWLVKGVLPDGGLSAIWGSPGCGKSFFALDIALSIARGVDWFGNATTQGGVIYVAAEAGRGVKKRLLAYKQRHSILPGTEFVLVPTPVDLCTADHETDALIAEIQSISAKMQQPLQLIVIDTLARVLAGGDENSGQDMGALIRNCDVIRETTNAALLLVHHGGKDRDRKTRGHSSLFGALDCAIEITANETSGLKTAKVRKQKDGEDGQCFAFKLDVEHVTDDVTSCVVEPSDLPQDAQEAAPRRKPSGVNAIALQALQMAVDEGGEPPPTSNHVPQSVRVAKINLWRRYFYKLRDGHEPDANQKAFRRAQDTLQSTGHCRTWGDISWLA